MDLPSNRLLPSLLALAGFVLAACIPAKAQQFSAELVTVHDNAATTPAGRLRVLDDKVRIEIPELSDGFFLIDVVKPAAHFVRPAARVFMDAGQSSRLIRLFVTVDPQDPCARWQTMAHLAGLPDRGNWHCEQVGEVAISGRNTSAYRVVSASGRTFFAWIDRARRFPLRIKTEEGAVITAEDIRDEPQPAPLFEMPPGLRKFDPQALIERIKQSDVWVAEEADAQPQ